MCSNLFRGYLLWTCPCSVKRSGSLAETEKMHFKVPNAQILPERAFPKSPRRHRAAPPRRGCDGLQSCSGRVPPRRRRERSGTWMSSRFDFHPLALVASRSTGRSITASTPFRATPNLKGHHRDTGFRGAGVERETRSSTQSEPLNMLDGTSSSTYVLTH